MPTIGNRPPSAIHRLPFSPVTRLFLPPIRVRYRSLLKPIDCIATADLTYTASHNINKNHKCGRGRQYEDLRSWANKPFSAGRPISLFQSNVCCPYLTFACYSSSSLTSNISDLLSPSFSAPFFPLCHKQNSYPTWEIVLSYDSNHNTPRRREYTHCPCYLGT